MGGGGKFDSRWFFNELNLKLTQIEIESEIFYLDCYRAYDDILTNLNYIHLIEIDSIFKKFVFDSYSTWGYNISKDYTVYYVVYLFNEYLWFLWVIMVNCG